MPATYATLSLTLSRPSRPEIHMTLRDDRRPVRGDPERDGEDV